MSSLTPSKRSRNDALGLDNSDNESDPHNQREPHLKKSRQETNHDPSPPPPPPPSPSSFPSSSSSAPPPPTMTLSPLVLPKKTLSLTFHAISGKESPRVKTLDDLLAESDTELTQTRADASALEGRKAVADSELAKLSEKMKKAPPIGVGETVEGKLTELKARLSSNPIYSVVKQIRKQISGLKASTRYKELLANRAKIEIELVAKNQRIADLDVETRDLFTSISGAKALHLSIDQNQKDRDNLSGSASDLFQEILNFEPTKPLLKQSFLKPNLLARRFTAQVVNRSSTLVWVLYSLAFRFQKMKAHRLDKHTHHFTALHSAPGGGKSFMLDIIAVLPFVPNETRSRMFQFARDHLATFKSAKLTVESLNELEKMINESIGINISFNSGFDTIEDEKNQGVEPYFVIRVLFSYFFNLGAIEKDNRSFFEMFVRHFVAKFSLATNTLFEVIKLHQESLRDLDENYVPRSNILLCVDETLLCPNPKMLISLLGRLLTNGNALNLVVSSLDVHYQKDLVAGSISSLSTLSGRQFDWVWLAPLSVRDSAMLICRQQTKDRLVSLTVMDDPLRNELELMEFFAFASNGHPRTLSLIHSELAGIDADSLNKSAILESLCKVDLLKQPVLTWNEIRLALLGNVQDTNRQIPLYEGPSRGFLSSLIAGGVFLNSLADKEETACVPRLSLLHIYTRSNIQIKGDLTNQSEFINLRKIFDLTFHRSGGDWFEEFSAYSECLRRLVMFPKIGDMQLTLNLLGGLFTICGPDGLMSPIIMSGSDKTITLDRRGFPPVKTVRGYASLDASRLALVRSEANPRRDLIFLGGTNLGFDYYCFEFDENGKPFVILTECKYSSRGANTSLSMDDIEKKVVSCCSLFDTKFRCMSINEKKIDSYSQLVIIFAVTMIAEGGVLDMKFDYHSCKTNDKPFRQKQRIEREGSNITVTTCSIPLSHDFSEDNRPTVAFIKRELMIGLFTPTLASTPELVSSGLFPKKPKQKAPPIELSGAPGEVVLVEGQVLHVHNEEMVDTLNDSEPRSPLFLETKKMDIFE